jgi:hypothetical protein
MAAEFNPAAAADKARGEWRYDEPMVGLGFHPEEVSLRRVRPTTPGEPFCSTDVDRSLTHPPIRTEDL